jgi:diguanylate cyclase (GGDEF)-like protein
MNAALKILLCDHRGEGLERRAQGLSAAGHTVEVARNLRQSLASLARTRPDVVVLDSLAGGASEAELLLRARASEPALPLLLVGELGAVAAEPLDGSTSGAWAWDAIVRDAPAEEFALRLERLRDLAQRRAEMDELRHRATHDDRTNLLRPREFDGQLVAHTSAAQRHSLDLALLLIDLDRFGQINKRHDHTVGDRIIERVGGAIRETLRVEDVAGRLGGDEFGVILPYTRRVDAASVVQRLLEAIRALSGPVPGAEGPLEVSASIGFETYDGRDLDSLETLRTHAEVALRHAKRRGGDQGVYFRSLAAKGEAKTPEPGPSGQAANQ